MKNIIRAYYPWFKSKFSSSYHFQISDANLYYHEITWQPKNIHVLDKSDGVLLYSIDGKSFLWPENFPLNELPWIYNEIFVPFSKNPNSFAHPNIDYSKLAWVIDAGAHEGFFTRFALDAGVKKVIAVEPLEELIDTLQLTFKNESVSVEKAVLGKEMSHIDLYVDPDHFCEASVNSQKGKPRKVMQLTVDHLVEKYKLSGPGLIKADIEGAEMNCLTGAQNTLKDLTPIIAFAVYHDLNNATFCAEIVRSCNPRYTLEYRGMNASRKTPRPHMLFGFTQ